MSAERIAFALFDSSGALKANATPTFTLYRARTGADRTAPSITNLGAGLYGFTASEEDLATGTAFIISGGSGAYAATGSARLFGVACLRNAPWFVQLFEDGVGTLWSGTAPTLAAWRDFDGNADASVPTIELVSTGLYGFTPTVEQVREGRAFIWSAPLNAYPINTHGTAHYGSSDPSETVLELLRDALLAEETVTELIGTRLYPQVMPDKVQTPAATIQVISKVPTHTTDVYPVAYHRLQLDCYARTYKEARAVWSAMEAVIKTLGSPGDTSGIETFLENERDLYEDATQLHRVSADVAVWLKS